MHQVSFFESLVWLDLGLNPGLPDHRWALYPLFQLFLVEHYVIKMDIIIILLLANFHTSFNRWFFVAFSYTGSCRIHTDAMNNRRMQEDFFKQNMYLSLYCKGSKRLFKVCVWEGAGDRTEQQYFDPHSYGSHVVSFLFSWCWGPLCWVLAFFTASYQHFLWT